MKGAKHWSLLILLLLWLPGLSQPSSDQVDSTPTPQVSPSATDEAPPTETPSPSPPEEGEKPPTPAESDEEEEKEDAPPAAAQLPEPVIYISDSENGRIVAVQGFDGKDFKMLGIPGFGIGRMLRPAQIWVDHDGKIYIADSGNDRVLRINDISGRGWSEMSGFKAPEGVAVSAGKLYISDTGNDQILVYDKFGGQLLETLKHRDLTAPTCIWADENGDLFIASGKDPPGGAVCQLSRQKDFWRWSFYKGEGRRSGGFAPKQCVTIGRKLWMTDSASHQLVRVDGIKGRAHRDLGRYGSGPGNFIRPSGLAVDKDKRLYVCDSGNDRIVRIDHLRDSEPEFFYGLDQPEGQLRAPRSIFVYSPAPPPPPPPEDEEGKKKKKKK